MAGTRSNFRCFHKHDGLDPGAGLSEAVERALGCCDPSHCCWSLVVIDGFQLEDGRDVEMHKSFLTFR
jgi:hypothetical protein